MSEHFEMNPSINLSYVDDTGYQDRTTRFQDAYFQNWGFSGSGISTNSVSGPTATVRSTLDPRSAERMNLQQPTKTVQHHNARFLAPPGPQSVPVYQNHAEPIADPITRFYQGDEPWNPMRYSNSSSGRYAFSQPQRSFRQYRQGPCSDLGSNAPISDSGYHTQPTQSILSHDPGRADQELPSELLLQTRTMKVHSTPNKSHEIQRMPSDQRSQSQYSSRSASHRPQFSCPEPDCEVVSKCQSEHKKHMLKHRKEFICEVTGCRRGGKGFSTINDLDRHKKCVHNIGVSKSKSYRCAAEGCENKYRVWPRLDNFKQHIDRMHETDDKFDLIKRSEFIPQDPQTTMQSEAGIDPSHLLAGMDSQTAMTTVDGNDSTLSEYPQFMSLSGRPCSGVSQVPPTTLSFDTSSSQTSTLSVNHTCSQSLGDEDFSRSRNGYLNHSSGTQKPSRASNLGKNTKPEFVQTYTLNSDQMIGLQLSSAAQTKTEQQEQRLNLGKLSKAQLKAIVLRGLELQRQDDGNPSSGSDLHNLVQKKSGPPRSQERHLTLGSTPSLQRCPFEDCGFVGRNCDLNKHLKRHAKPYGCTYPRCYKKFGAKSDWKRHENSQHFQQETFRCCLQKSGETCGQHFYHATQFTYHIEHEHKIVAKEGLQDMIGRCKIGKNCQGQYWCGFCCKIQKLQTRRNYAWDERFDHIAHHFEKDDPKKNIDDWICVEENRTKRELQEARRDDQGDKDATAQSFDEEIEPSVTHEVALPATASPFCTLPQRTSSKRPASADAIQAQPSSKRAKVEISWICCECGNGPMSTSLNASCLCAHVLCNRCESFQLPTDL